MGQQTLFEKIGVQYEERDGLCYPLITLDIKEDGTNVGKYGRMWMQYLKSEYPQRYRSLLRFGELKQKAAEVNEVAYELLEDIETKSCCRRISWLSGRHLTWRLKDWSCRKNVML